MPVLCVEEGFIMPLMYATHTLLARAPRLVLSCCRCDHAKAFSYEECSQWGAAGGILLERLLPELAFKLGRASKYGA